MGGGGEELQQRAGPDWIGSFLGATGYAQTLLSSVNTEVFPCCSQPVGGALALAGGSLACRVSAAAGFGFTCARVRVRVRVSCRLREGV